jgi:hypothetical protein
MELIHLWVHGMLLGKVPKFFFQCLDSKIYFHHLDRPKMFFQHMGCLHYLSRLSFLLPPPRHPLLNILYSKEVFLQPEPLLDE